MQASTSLYIQIKAWSPGQLELLPDRLRPFTTEPSTMDTMFLVPSKGLCNTSTTCSIFVNSPLAASER